MHTLTYRFTAPLIRPPISSIVGDNVVCQIHPDFLEINPSGSPYVLGAVSARTHSGQTWTYTVQIEDSALTSGVTVSGKFLPTLSGLSVPEKMLLARKPAERLQYEVFGPSENVGNETRWVGNPDVAGTITAIRASVHTAGTSTLQLSLAGSPIFSAPISLASLTQRVTVSKVITSGQRINAVTTGTTYGKAKGLQLEFCIQP